MRVLTVVEPFPLIAIEPWYGGRESLERIDREVQKRARDLTKKTSETLRKKGFKIESALRKGDARSEIIDKAEKCPADLIVIGSHGYNGIKRLFLGSVASSVATLRVRLKLSDGSRRRNDDQRKITHDNAR